MPTRLTRFPGGILVGGGSGQNRYMSSSPVYSFRASFDPTSATPVLLGIAPPGARVLDIISYGGSTGGASPTVDIGTLATNDLFANELKANLVSSAVAAVTGGTGLGALLTVATPIYGKVGASAATGGATVVQVNYTVEIV
jgi:hypothetical protein